MAKNIFDVLDDPYGLNIKFYERYDEKFLWRKASVLISYLTQTDAMWPLINDESDLGETEKTRYVETISAELHFTEAHQFEAFFSLLVAIFQKRPHWLFLTEYHTSEIKRKAQAYIDRRYADASNGLVDGKESFIMGAVFSGYRSDNEQIKANWEQIIDDLDWYIRLLARRYIRAHEYNAYKHGLRVLTGSSYLQWKPDGSNDEGLVLQSENSLQFLKVEKINECNKNKTYIVKKIFKHFDPMASINHIAFMMRALENIKSTRLSRLNNQGQANLSICLSPIDRETLSSLSRNTSWTMTL